MQSTRNLYLFPIALIFLEIAIFLSNDMYLPSMPTIAHDLNLSTQQIQATLTLWFLGSSSLQLILGPISDRFGRKRVVLIGGLVYIISSYICARAYDINLLLVARFVQGSTICAVLVAGSAAVHESCNTKMAIKVFAFINAVTVLAPAFGPLIGALTVQVGHWRDIFWLLFVLGIIGTTLIAFYMPRTTSTKHAMHWRGIFKDYIRLFTNKEYMLPNLAYGFMLGISFLWMFEAPFLMIETYGISNFYYGIGQTCVFGCFFVGAQLTRWMLNRHNLKKLINTAMLITLIGAMLFTLIAKFTDNMILSIMTMMIITTGSSALFSPLGRLAVEASDVPMGRRMAITSTVLSLFGAFSGWLVGVVDVHSLINMSVLILIYAVLAVILLAATKVPVLFVD